jgi:hypothetical protein
MHPLLFITSYSQELNQNEINQRISSSKYQNYDNKLICASTIKIETDDFDQLFSLLLIINILKINDFLCFRLVNQNFKKLITLKMHSLDNLIVVMINPQLDIKHFLESPFCFINCSQHEISKI